MQFLWDKYLQDFFHYKLLASIEFEKNDIGEYLMKMLEEYFRPLKQERNVVRRIISLHTHIKLNRLYLARVINTLHSVNHFLMAENEHSFIRPMGEEAGSISCRNSDLAEYIVKDMFRALTKAMVSPQAYFECWYEAYFNLVSFFYPLKVEICHLSLLITIDHNSWVKRVLARRIIWRVKEAILNYAYCFFAKANFWSIYKCLDCSKYSIQQFDKGIHYEGSLYRIQFC